MTGTRARMHALASPSVPHDVPARWSWKARLKHRYAELDGLRGVAALSVVAMHMRPWFGPDIEPLLANRAYLAVDFFLLLSGFVIEHAYAQRLRMPGMRLAFLRDRIIRLHPLLVLAAGVGLATLAYDTTLPRVSQIPGASLAMLAAVPLPVSGYHWAVPINYPLWSLFWELLFSLLFALAAPALTTRRIAAVAAGCLLFTIWIARGRNSLDFGAMQDFLLAGPRLAFAFLTGMLLLRVHRAGVLAGPVSRVWLAPALLVSFVLLPRSAAYSWIYDLAALCLAFPFLVLAAAGAQPWMVRVAEFSGAVSYPLYVLHIPFLRYAWTMLPTEVAPSPLLGLAALAATVIAAWLSFVLYDKPVRAWLRPRLGSCGHREPPSATTLTAN